MLHSDSSLVLRSGERKVVCVNKNLSAKIERIQVPTYQVFNLISPLIRSPSPLIEEDESAVEVVRCVVHSGPLWLEGTQVYIVTISGIQYSIKKQPLFTTGTVYNMQFLQFPLWFVCTCPSHGWKGHAWLVSELQHHARAIYLLRVR